MNPWKFLDGKKTILSAAAGPVIVFLVGKGYLDPDTERLVISVWMGFTGIAFGHKAVKAKG